MADQVEQALRDKPLRGEGLAFEVREFLNRELLPLLREARAILNRRFGRDVVVTEEYTVQTRDETVFVDASGGSFTVTLPSVDGWRRTLYLVLTDGASYTLAPADGELLDGGAAATVSSSLTLRPGTTGFWSV